MGAVRFVSLAVNLPTAQAPTKATGWNAFVRCVRCHGRGHAEVRRWLCQDFLDPHDPLLAQNPYVERMDYDEEDEIEP